MGWFIGKINHKTLKSPGSQLSYFMGFDEVIAKLPRLTFEQRQILIREALELDDLPMSTSDEALVEERLAAHHADPESSILLDELKATRRSRAS